MPGRDVPQYLMPIMFTSCSMAASVVTRVFLFRFPQLLESLWMGVEVGLFWAKLFFLTRAEGTTSAPPARLIPSTGGRTLAPATLCRAGRCGRRGRLACLRAVNVIASRRLCRRGSDLPRA